MKYMKTSDLDNFFFLFLISLLLTKIYVHMPIYRIQQSSLLKLIKVNTEIEI